MIWGGGSDDVFVQLRTNLEISTDPVVTQYLHQWTLSSTLEMAFFPGMKLRLNRGTIGCSPNSVPMLWVWRFLWGILILSWNHPRGLPNYPLTQLSRLLQLSFPAVLCQNTGNTGGRPHHFSQATTLSPCKPPGGQKVWIRDFTWLWCWRKIDHKRPYAIYILYILYVYIVWQGAINAAKSWELFSRRWWNHTALQHPTTTPLRLSPLLRPPPICSVLRDRKDQRFEHVESSNHPSSWGFHTFEPWHFEKNEDE